MRIIHWSTTTLVCLLFTASALTYLFLHEDVSETFELNLGFPAWLVYPMAIAKLGAVIMLMSKFNQTLTEWAYAGLVFMMLLAVGAHVATGESQIFAPIVALILIFGSYFSWKQKLKSGSDD